VSPLEFPQLSGLPLQHLFTLRQHPAFPDPDSLLVHLQFPHRHPVQAEQPHGNKVAVAGPQDQGRILPGADALVTRIPGLTLIIRVADCGPVYFYDPVHHCAGIAHSGRKGTEAGVVPATIRQMGESYGSRPEDLLVVLGPCIRPPHYEIDFAAAIAAQARDCGVKDFHDCGCNTASDLARFYSYRMEKGRTGRHYAVLALDFI